LSGLEGVEQKIDPALWRPIDIQFQDGDATKVETELGWKPTIHIDQTLADLLQYWVKKLKNSD